MGDRQAKDALFDAFGDVAKALGSGRRAELIDVLCQGERHVDELAGEIGHSVANTSFHLRALATAGLVTTRRDGTRVFYRLASERVADLWAALRDVTAAHHEHLDELATAYLGDRDLFEQISQDELAERLAAGDVIVLDVRPAAEYEAGHIAGAISIPIDELSASIKQLPADVDIVAYCRGPYCVFADDAVRILRRRRRHARRLQGGFPEWRQARLPIETGAASPNIPSGAQEERGHDDHARFAMTSASMPPVRPTLGSRASRPAESPPGHASPSRQPPRSNLNCPTTSR